MSEQKCHKMVFTGNPNQRYIILWVDSSQRRWLCANSVCEEAGPGATALDRKRRKEESWGNKK